MRSLRLAAPYPHSTANWRISACDNECSRIYRTPGNPNDGSRPLCARQRRCAPKNCPSSVCALASPSATFASESRRNGPSPRPSAAGAHSAGPRRSGTSLAVDSSPAGSSRVNPASACTSRKRSISTTLSIHGAYLAGDVPTRTRRFAPFFAGSGFENSFHSGSFKSLGGRGAGLSCKRNFWIAAQICASVCLSYRGWPLRTSLTSRSDSTSSNSDVRSCSTNCSNGSADDGMESADSVRENHILVAPRVMGCDGASHSSSGATRRCGSLTARAHITQRQRTRTGCVPAVQVLAPGKVVDVAVLARYQEARRNGRRPREARAVLVDEAGALRPIGVGAKLEQPRPYGR